MPLSNRAPELLNALPLAKKLQRLPDTNKAHSGKVLCIGGSVGMAGALLLSAKSVLYSGAGYAMLCMLDSHSAHALAEQPGRAVRPLHRRQPLALQRRGDGDGAGDGRPRVRSLQLRLQPGRERRPDRCPADGAGLRRPPRSRGQLARRRPQRRRERRPDRCPDPGVVRRDRQLRALSLPQDSII